jgi:glutathione reductase (NADPH)
MSRIYDVIVLGSGVAGGVAARKLKEEGMSVAMVDPGPLGGTCPLRGCEPKKVLFDAVDAMVRSIHHNGHGLQGNPGLDWQELIRFKNTFTDPVPGNIEKDLARRGIDLFPEQGRFVNSNTIQAGEQHITGDRIVICTGATSRPLEFYGAEYITPSYQFFDLHRLPARMVIIGGGYIAFEFAHLAIRAGVQVELLVRSEWCLKAFDPDLVRILVRYSQDLGIGIHFNAPVDHIHKQDAGYLVSAGGGEMSIETDLILHGAGRIPHVDGLDCHKGDVDVSKEGIVVNEYLQSVSNPFVYAAGDVVATGPQLTPVALMEAEVVASNILRRGPVQVDYTGMPSNLFTHPVMARTGRLERECEEQGLESTVLWADASNWSSYQRLGEDVAAIKILTHPQTDEVLGAHVLGRNAEEVVNIFALAIQQGISRTKLAQTVWSYPSFVYDTIRHVLA